jgi:hypothetical protein
MGLQDGVKFDATINLGHILTFVGFIATIFVSWQTLDKRLIVLEAAEKTQSVIDQSQDEKVISNNHHLAESLSDIRKSIDRLNDKLDRKP